jgi:xylulokinase
MDAFLGVDLGTSGLKLALLGLDGALLAEAESPYEVVRPRTGWAETDPARWIEALGLAVDAIADRLAAYRLGGIGVTGQMHGAVLCAEDGTPVRPAVLWPDRRAEPQLRRWRELPRPVREALANPLVPGMTGPIVSWLAEHEPQTVARASRVLLPKDYLRGVLSGGAPGRGNAAAVAVTDRTDASATLLWDVVADGWSAAAVAGTGVPATLLPPVVEPAAVVGHSSWPYARFGRPAGEVPVAAGCGDTPAALLAVGHAGTKHAGSAPAGIDPHATQINLGTGAQVLRRVPAPYPVSSPTTHLYAAPDQGWYAMAAVQNAGLALDWTARLLGLRWPQLIAAAAATAAGAGGVSFLPFLTGERGGFAGPTSRGSWLGLQASTTREDLARAAVEAMVFVVRRAAELLGPIGPTVRLTGGGGREPLIRQLLADCLGVEVHRTEVRSASATGAALLAARAVGTPLAVRPAGGGAVPPRTDEALDESYRRWCDRLGAADA